MSFHQSTCQRRRSCRTTSSMTSSPLASKTRDWLELTFYRRQPCRIPQTQAFTRSGAKTVTLPISTLPAFPPLGSGTRQLDATHAPSTVPLPSSVPAHNASTKISFHYIRHPQRRSLLPTGPCRPCFDEHSATADRSHNLPRRPRRKREPATAPSSILHPGSRCPRRQDVQPMAPFWKTSRDISFT